jgi:hypothetical protein
VRPAARAYSACTPHRLHVRRFHVRVLTKNVDRRSLYPTAPQSKDKPMIKEAARKDSAVHVSLSSNSLVKQPGSETTPTLRQTKGPSKHQSSRQRSEAFSHRSVRSFEGAPSRRQAGGDAVWWLYSLRSQAMSTHSNPKIRICNFSSTNHDGARAPSYTKVMDDDPGARARH